MKMDSQCLDQTISQVNSDRIEILKQKERYYEEGDDSSNVEPFFTDLPDLACDMNGGAIIFATDDWFAAAENMLKVEDAVFKEELFTDQGKWMDGWETRRKRTPGHDWCIIQLGCAGVIHGIEVSTLHFTGNYPPQCSIQAAELNESYKPRAGIRIGTCAPELESESIKELNSENWETLVPRASLGAGFEETHRTFFEVASRKRYTHIRLNIYPDGGVARLRVYGEVKPNWKNVDEKDIIDLVSMKNGGICVGCSDAHYGHAKNVIAPGRARKMNEGWETARQKDRPPILTDNLLHTYAEEWAVYKLGHPGIILTAEIDTNHFKGNFPYSFTLEGAFIDGVLENEELTDDDLLQVNWQALLSECRLKGHERHFYGENEVKNIGKINYVRLSIMPDGGISRMHLMGHPCFD